MRLLCLLNIILYTVGVNLKMGIEPHISPLIWNRNRVGVSLPTHENITLHLKTNFNLISPEYVEIKIRANGSQSVVRQASDITKCWFVGKVVGDPLSQVVVTNCEGIFWFY